MQKRLLRHPGQRRHHRGGLRRCHHLVGAAGVDRRPRRRLDAGAPSAPTAAAERSDLADRPDPPRRPRREEPPTLDPSKAPGLDIDRRPPRPQPGPVYFDKDLKPGPVAGDRAADDLGRRQDLHVHPAGRASTATATRSSPVTSSTLASGSIDPRTASTSGIPTSGRDRRRRRTSLGRWPAPSRPRRDADDRRRPRQARRRRRRTTRPFVVTLATPATYFLDIVGPVGRRADPGEVDHDPELHRGRATTSAPARSCSKSGPTTAEIVLKPNPNWYGEQADPDRDRLLHRWRSDRPTRPPTRPASSTWSRPARPDIRAIKADADLGPQVVDPAGPRDSTTGASTSAKRPDGQQGLPRRADRGDRQGDLHRRDRLRRPGRRRQQLRSCRACPGYQADIDLYPYDLTAAKARLAHGAHGARRTATSAGPRHADVRLQHRTPATSRASRSWPKQWRQTFGLETELDRLRLRPFFLDQRTAGVFSIARDALGRGLPAPEQPAPRAVPERERQQRQPVQATRSSTPCRAGRRRAGPGQAIALYNQAQELLVNDAPAVFTRWRISNYEVQPYVQGVTGTGTGLGRHRRPVLRDHLDRQALGASALAVRDGARVRPRPAPPAPPALQGPGRDMTPPSDSAIQDDRGRPMIRYLIAPALPVDHPGALHGLDHHVHRSCTPSRADRGTREKRLPASVIAALNAKYGLDQPVPLQYITLGRQARSRATSARRTSSQDRTVNDIVADGIWTTVQLGADGVRRCPCSSASRSGSSPPSATTAGPTTSRPASRSSASPRPASCWRSC